MAQPVVKPQFPVAPQEYDQRYLSELVRSFSVFVEQIQNPGPGRATQLTLTDLQSNDFELETGALFQVDGTVKITQANTPHVVGSGSTGSVGTVTVSTP
tara:strand:- start:522 stop:818 length:297 start_codon:yes stop_codon:yes gene_type:complete